ARQSTERCSLPPSGANRQLHRRFRLPRGKARDRARRRSTLFRRRRTRRCRALGRYRSERLQGASLQQSRRHDKSCRRPRNNRRCHRGESPHPNPPPQAGEGTREIIVMKFTLSWLKEHLETDEPLEKLADKLTMIGLEVENIEDKAKALAPFTIARVISAEQHPNADRLRVCMVDTGDGGAPVQVVCGAPNARAGLISVFSPPGTYIPGKDITLGVGTIRGVESRGMLCSAAELQISEDHDGIMELPGDAPLGKGYADWAGL
ncbi:hypothetical protein chiPu_0029636, partial [Chiloscyllium punctatum]|nr:hypothetical protein [Chiloscyllium punctatum]